jgi:hypothetical protein
MLTGPLTLPVLGEVVTHLSEPVTPGRVVATLHWAPESSHSATPAPEIWTLTVLPRATEVRDGPLGGVPPPRME